MDANSTATTAERSANEKVGRSERLFALLQRHGALAVLILVVAVSTFAFDRFFTFENLENIAAQSSFLALIAVGMTFVIISKGIDLSVGSLLALGGVLAAYSVQVAWLLALIVPVLACGGIGLLNGLLIAKAKMAPFIVTLAALLGVRGLVLAIAGERTIGISGDPLFTWFGRGEILGISVPIFIMVLAFAVGALVLNRTGYGQAIFAIGGSEDAAQLMGVAVDRTKIIAYTVSGSLAGLAGALLAARLSAGQPVAGAAWELDAIAAVVVGGTLLTGGAGTMGGSLVGVLILGVLQNLINQVGTLSSYTQQMASGAFLIVVVTAQIYLTRNRTF
ncbi:MAG: ABC transporter permease [Actinomycetota bacterium]|jgi:ribose/xylose/arabinose/galactoside ABC-type transport system permease subunit|nr:ABC transporter permease [Actinomycetota bacterium]